MNTRRIRIGEVTVPGAFQSHILKRALGDDGLVELYNNYIAARLHGHASAEPTNDDYKMLDEYKANRTPYIRIGEMFGIRREKPNSVNNFVQSRIRKAALYRVLNS